MRRVGVSLGGAGLVAVMVVVLLAGCSPGLPPGPEGVAQPGQRRVTATTGAAVLSGDLDEAGLGQGRRLRPLLAAPPAPLATPPPPTKTGVSGCPTRLAGGWVRAENARPGTGLPPRSQTFTTVKAWADRASARCGEVIGVHASTTGHAVRAAVYRIGWYAGTGTRLIWSAGPVPAGAQPAARATTDTHMVETSWPVTFTIPVGPLFPPGLYLVRVLDDRGGSALVPFVVRGPAGTGQRLLVAATFTWQAYNLFGGYDLYRGPGGGLDRSYVVSFDRPYDAGAMARVLGQDARAVRFSESLGLDADYATDNDLAATPALMAAYRGVVFVGHDE